MSSQAPAPARATVTGLRAWCPAAPTFDEAGYQQICWIQIVFNNGRTATLLRMWSPVFGAFTIDPSTPPDAAMQPGMPLDPASPTNNLAPHPTFGFADPVFDDIRALPQAQRELLFPENYPQTVRTMQGRQMWGVVPFAADQPVPPLVDMHITPAGAIVFGNGQGNVQG